MRGRVWINRDRVYLYIGFEWRLKNVNWEYHHDTDMGYHWWMIDCGVLHRVMVISLRIGSKTSEARGG